LKRSKLKYSAKWRKKAIFTKALKPVYWSPSSESALAEAEIEYHDKRSPSIYVAFDVKDGKGVLTNGEKIVIWTTTPWTIPANLGIAVHPDLEYSVVAAGGARYVMASALIESVAKAIGFEDHEVVQDC
jgi:isoleucyl-tRNA synthetase